MLKRHATARRPDIESPRAASRLTDGFVDRQIVQLCVLCAVAVVGVLATRTAAGAHRALRQRDAAAWYAAGERARARGNTAEAIEALRRATALTHDRADYRLTLASVLADDHQDAAARQMLLALRETAPDDPDVNAHLARLEARRKDVDRAVHYYQSALYGLWRPYRSTERRTLRLELIHYLLATDRQRQALSELLVLVGSLSDDVTSHLEAGTLLRQAGDARRSLEQFRAALRLDGKNRAALAGAGAATFALGEYAAADRYFRAASRAAGPIPAEAARLQTVAALVVSHDPLVPRLSADARYARLGAGLTAAMARIETCRSAMVLPEDRVLSLIALRERAKSFAAAMTPRAARDLDVVQDGVALIARLEDETREGCPSPTPVDEALLLIGRRQSQ